MHITLTKDYSVKADTTLLGYQGETNSRKITFSGLVVDGCNLYKLQILYSDGKVYELPIQDEVVTITGSILREIGYVSCQLLGYSVSGNNYTIVFKSNIFELEIKESIDGEVAPIPPYEEATGALEKILDVALIVRSFFGDGYIMNMRLMETSASDTNELSLSTHLIDSCTTG